MPLLLLPVPAADAALTAPNGVLCGYSEVGGGVEFDAGPISLVDEDDPTVVHTATITCSIQASGDQHADPDWLSVTSSPGTGVAVLPPTLVPVPGPFPWEYWSCTRLDVAGGPTLYWHEPYDRNHDGWWTTDPFARCDSSLETLDGRPEDPPGAYLWTSLATASGEADLAVEVVEPVICSEPSLAPVADAAWACGAPSRTSSVSFVRTALGAAMRGLPFGWACTDVHTGLAVTRGSTLATPDPGVSCVPPPGYGVYCGWIQVSGYLAPTVLGRVDVTAACQGGSVTRRLAPAQGRVVEQWSNGRAGLPPLRCSAAEDASAEPAYAVFCNVLG